MGVNVGPDAPRSIAEFLNVKAEVWDRIVEKHRLRKVSLPDFLGESHYYADFCFAYGAEAPPPAAFVSTIKIRQDGFQSCMNTRDTFVDWTRDLIERKLLPSAA